MRHQQQSGAGRYRLLAPIGAGAMGAVFRAHDRLAHADVALKRVALGATDADGLRLALASEFRVLAGLRHPHIISVLDYGFDAERQPFFTMELLAEARPLPEGCAGLPLTRQIDLLIQALEALAYLHRRGVLHHDLKPANMLVSEGRVRLLDFGLAVLAQQQRPDDSFGTLQYLAPEVLDGQPYTESADLYSFGVIAYEIFARVHPFHADTIDDFLARVFTEPPDLSALASQPGLAAVVGQLLAKAPEERPASAQAVIAMLRQATGQPELAADPAIRESYLQAASFVGRAAELARLLAAMGQARQGQGSAWLVGGESGVGKSRFLDELRTQALVEGALVVRGHAVEGGGLPYQLWREPLRRLVLSADLDDLEAGVLKPIVPDISSLLERDIADAPELPGEAGQQRLVQALVDVVRKQPQTLVLLLEDLQWSSESLEPLKRLALLVGDLPLLIVANYRSDERPHLPGDLPGMQPISLARLSAAEVAELSAGMLGEGGRSPAIVERLRQETEGNTFFMVEVVRALAEAAGRLGAIEDLPLPRSIMAGGIQRIVQRRLERVPPWGQKLLRFAALTGRQLELPVLKALADNGQAALGGRSLEAWLTLCGDVAVLDIQDEQWRFSHDKLREYLQQAIAAEPDAALYRALAEAFEQAYGADAAQAPRLSHYWLAAGEAEKAGQYAEVAGAQAADSSDYASAAQFFERALGALAQGAPHPRRGPLLVKLADAVRETGEVDRSTQLLEEALDIAAASDDRSLRMHALNGLGDNERWQMKIDLAEHHYREASQLAEELVDRPMLVKTLRNCARVQGLQGNYAESRASLLRVLDLAQGLQDELIIGNSRYEIALMDLHMGGFDAAIEGFNTALATFDRLGSLSQAIFTLSNLGMAYFNLQQWELASQHFERELSLARTLGSPNILANALGDCSMIPLTQNRLDEAEPLITEALGISRTIKWSNGIIRNLMNLSEIKRMRQDYQAGKRLISEALDIVIERNVRWAINAILVMVAGGLTEEGSVHQGYEIYDFLKHDPQTSQSDFAQIELIFAENQQRLSEEVRAEIHQCNRHRTVEDIIAIARTQLTDQGV